MKKQLTPSQEQAIKTKYLEHAYNLTHGDSRCAARAGRRHRFRVTSRREIAPGRAEEISACQFCGAKVKSTLDYGMTAAFFSAVKKH